jgi:site-specific recombinase XerD
LADVPPEAEWFANLTNAATRRAYENAIKDFMRFVGIQNPAEFRTVTRTHAIAWRDDLTRRGRSGSTIRHRLAAFSSLFDYRCEKNAVSHNPVKGVKRSKADSNEGRTPALGDHQASELLDAPDGATLKAKRDRAILSTSLYHALRRDELCKLTVKDFRHERSGVPYLKVSGKGGKTRYAPLHPTAGGLVYDYLELAGHAADEIGALFRSVSNNSRNGLGKAITSDGIYKIVRAYSTELGFTVGVHSLRATAATNALDHQADIAKVGMAGTRQHRHDTDLRPPQDEAGGQPDVQGGLLNCCA